VFHSQRQGRSLNIYLRRFIRTSGNTDEIFTLKHVFSDEATSYPGMLCPLDTFRSGRQQSACSDWSYKEQPRV